MAPVAPVFISEQEGIFPFNKIGECFSLEMISPLREGSMWRFKGLKYGFSSRLANVRSLDGWTDRDRMIVVSGGLYEINREVEFGYENFSQPLFSERLYDPYVRHGITKCMCEYRLFLRVIVPTQDYHRMNLTMDLPRLRFVGRNLIDANERIEMRRCLVIDQWTRDFELIAEGK